MRRAMKGISSKYFHIKHVRNNVGGQVNNSKGHILRTFGSNPASLPMVSDTERANIAYATKALHQALVMPEKNCHSTAQIQIRISEDI